MRSKYDELHDHYYALLSSKSGTRYERLAAVVFKCLDEAGTVIHDLKLHGESGVAHQIDVTIERNGENKRLLVECKDFDVSGSKVGLDIVRSFFGVVEDVKPDESHIVTCTGFTRDARKYAKAKRINLAILREFQESDWEGKVKDIILQFHCVSASEPEVSVKMEAAARAKLEADRLAAGLSPRGVRRGTPVFINAPEGRLQFNEFIKERMKFSVHDLPGPRAQEVDLNGVTLEIENRGPISLQALTISYEVRVSDVEINAGGERIARLLVQGIGPASVVIWDDELKKFAIDSDGQVESRLTCH